MSAAEVGVILIVAGAVVHLAERFMAHRERVAELKAERGTRHDVPSTELRYTAGELVLAMRAVAHRAAGPDEGPELLDAIVQTVAEDLDAGVLTDPRDTAPPA